MFSKRNTPHCWWDCKLVQLLWTSVWINTVLKGKYLKSLTCQSQTLQAWAHLVPLEFNTTWPQPVLCLSAVCPQSSPDCLQENLKNTQVCEDGLFPVMHINKDISSCTCVTPGSAQNTQPLKTQWRIDLNYSLAMLTILTPDFLAQVWHCGWLNSI